MATLARVSIAAGLLLGAAAALRARPEKPSWPLTLRDGIPGSLPGYSAAPRDPLPDTDENEMGVYTEVSRFFQRIEGPQTTRQFRIVVQDYGPGKDLEAQIRKAVGEAGRSPSVEAAETKLKDRPAFAVTDRSGPRPTTLVTIVVTRSRLVLGQGSNVDREEALKLLALVDLERVATAR
jgi:hypothetical protein